MKQTYQTPAIEIIEMENEGIIAASNQPMPNRPWGTEVLNPAEMEPTMPGDEELMA